MKLCKRCRRVLLEADFYPSSGRTCKTCWIEKTKNHRQTYQSGGGGIALSRSPNGDEGSVRQKILKLPYGHPVRERYFKNRAEFTEQHKAMERWAGVGAISVPFSETG